MFSIKYSFSDIIAVFALVVSVFFPIRNSLKSRPKILIDKNGKDNAVIEPDFLDSKIPLDLYQNRRYRILIEFTIKNVSSSPITILSIKLNNFFDYNQYVIPAAEYQVTTQAAITTVNGIIFGGQGKTSVYGRNMEWLKLPLNLEPSHATKGFIIIPMYERDIDKVRLNSNKNRVVMETTSKNFKFKIHIGGIVKRDSDLPKNVLWK